MKGRIVSIFICTMIITSISASITQNTGQPQNIGQPNSSSSGTGGLADSPWPTFSQNSRRTGISPYDTSSNPGKLKWNFLTGGDVKSPVIGSDNTIYVGSSDGKLYAINPDGTEKWSFTTNGYVGLSPAIGSDGTIYFGSREHKLYALNPDGTEKWNFTTDGRVNYSPAIGSDGTIYVPVMDGTLFAINQDGTEKWRFMTVWGYAGTPAIATDGTIYFGDSERRLYAIDPDGTEKWNFSANDHIATAPAIGPNGTIYAGARDHNLYAINPDGTEQWRFPAGGPIGYHSSPAIASDGTIYVGSNDHNLYAINPDGIEKWRFPTNSLIQSAPAIGSDGTIHFGSDDFNIYAINPDGTLKWNFTTGFIVHSSPAIGSDGTIYIGSFDKKLYAIGRSTQNQPPIANAGPDQTVNEGDSLQLDASSSSDPDGTIVTYKWDFDSSDGLWWETGSIPDATDLTPTHTYGDNGIYTATLKVTDDSGANDIDICNVTVYNVAPTGEANMAQKISEEWVARYDGPNNYYDFILSMAVDSFGNAYVTGGSEKNYTTIKYDINGNELWVASYNGPGDMGNSAWDIAVDSSGYVYVTGQSYGIGTHRDYATIKYDPDGNELWVARYDGEDDDVAYAIAVDYQGYVYVTGMSSTIKYDPNGNQIWVRGGVDKALDIVVDDLSGNVYVVGWSGGEITTMAYNKNGNGLWTKGNGPCTYFSPGGKYIALDSTGNIYVTGTTRANGTSGDYTTIKYDSSGNEIWVAKYNSPGNGIDYTFGVDLDSSGNIYVTGRSYFPSRHYREFVTIKYDHDGNEIWVANYSGGSGRAIKVDDSLGLIYVTGTSSDDGLATMTTVAYDQNGNELWVAKYNGPGGEDRGVCVGVDSLGNVYVSGYSKGNGTYIDYCVIKYSKLFYYECDEGSSVIFTANATDPGSDDLTFTWDWGDGTSDTVTTYYNNGMNPEPIYDTSNNEIKSPLGLYPFTATDSVSYTYGDDGIYNVTITIEDDDGGVSTYTMKVTVQNVAPTIEPFGPLTIDEGSPFDITATSFDPGSDDHTFVWEFEDGPTISNTHHNDGMNPDPYPSPWGTYPFSATDTVSHVYGDDGNFTIALTVTDDDGGIAVYETYVLVNNVAPSITSFNYTILRINEPRTVGYWGHQCEVEYPYGDHTGILQKWIDNISSQSQVFSWISTVDDVESIVQDGDASDMIVMAKRQLMGVWLNVVSGKLHPMTEIDMSNLTVSKTVWESILEIEDVILNSDNRTELERVKDIADNINNGNGIALGIVEFTASATDPGADDLSFHWDFGDGKSKDNFYPNPGGVFPISASDYVMHSYFSLGTFTVTLTVSDDDGGTATTTLMIELPG